MRKRARPARSAQLLNIDPFAIHITGTEDRPVTLFDVAYAQARVPLPDLRALNPDLDAVPADALLQEGTTLRLPARPAMEGEPFGVSIGLRDAEEQLVKAEATLSDLLARYEVAHGTDSLPALPRRKVQSKTEQVIATIASETTRQLPVVEASFQGIGRRERALQYLVDVSKVTEKETEVERLFDPAEGEIKLESFKPDVATWLHHPHRHIAENYLSPADLQTSVDEEEDFCVVHSHRWELVLCGANSPDEYEGWALLSCQKLTTLFDAMRECRSVQPCAETLSRNAFIFIGGVFYIDDRHASDSDYEDLSKAIRAFNPLPIAAQQERAHDSEGGNGAVWDAVDTAIHAEAASASEFRNTAFGNCPVRNAADTTVGDLHLRLGEMGVVRHHGNCNHYFFVRGARSLGGYLRRERRQFPHRIFKRKERAVRCRMCHQLPATVALYEDDLSPCSPALYCGVCFELLHGGDNESGEHFFKAVFKKNGEYFKQ